MLTLESGSCLSVHIQYSSLCSLCPVFVPMNIGVCGKIFFRSWRTLRESFSLQRAAQPYHACRFLASASLCTPPCPSKPPTLLPRMRDSAYPGIWIMLFSIYTIFFSVISVTRLRPDEHRGLWQNLLSLLADFA